MIRVDESTVLVCTPAVLLLVTHDPYPSPPVVGARGQERAA